MLGFGLVARVLHHRLHDFREVEIFLVRSLAAFQLRQCQQFADHFIQLGRFAADPVQRRRQLGGILPRQPDGQVQPRQRGAQFVADIGQQPVAGRDQFLQPHRHAVKVARQVGDLVAPPPHGRPQARREIALRQPAETALHQPHRHCQIPGQDGGKHQPAHAEADQHLARQGKQAAHPRRLRRHIDGAIALAVGRRRHVLRQRARAVIGLRLRLHDDLPALVMRPGLQLGLQRRLAALMDGRCRRRHGHARHGAHAARLFARIQQREQQPDALGDQHKGDPEADQDFPEQPALHGCTFRR